jgi:hypothetical protein
MFQKHNTLLNQTKNNKLYRFSLRIPVLIVITILLFYSITSAETPVKTNVPLAARFLGWMQPAVVISNDALLYYGLGLSFIVGMLILSLVTTRNAKKQGKLKDLEQERMITQMQVNEKQSQILNEELTVLLDNRTMELKKSMETIKKLNDEILALNATLKTDTKWLNLDVELAGKAPALSKFADFEAFSKIYPDKDAILKYIAGLKWDKGYSCIRCCNETFLAGQTPYGRRCTKCGYDESATVNTIFHNSKILINKALYMLILVYNTKGAISSYKLAELLDIRQSTCWVYSSKFKKKLLQSKDGLNKTDGEGWSQMVLDEPV